MVVRTASTLKPRVSYADYVVSASARMTHVVYSDGTKVGTVSLQMGFNLPGVGRTAAPASAGEESPGSEGQGAGGNPGRSDPTESATETRPPAPASAEASKGEKVG